MVVLKIWKGFYMPKNIFITVCIAVKLPLRLKDGGTVEYKALAYSDLRVHRLAPAKAEKEYEEGIIIKVLGIEVYNNVE